MVNGEGNSRGTRDPYCCTSSGDRDERREQMYCMCGWRGRREGVPTGATCSLDVNASKSAHSTVR